VRRTGLLCLLSVEGKGGRIVSRLNLFHKVSEEVFDKISLRGAGRVLAMLTWGWSLCHI
jgi:hypothetical protein